jgi:hypothetical protein
MSAIPLPADDLRKKMQELDKSEEAITEATGLPDSNRIMKLLAVDDKSVRNAVHALTPEQ